MKFVHSVMALMLLLGACGREDPVYTPYVDSYRGTYMWRDTTIVFDAAVIDSIEFTITDGYLYAFRFYQLDATDRVHFCDCEGRLSLNTSTLVKFEPTGVVIAGCDSLNIPRGEFIPDYVTHRPDTVYFEKRDGVFLYQLVVVPK